MSKWSDKPPTLNEVEANSFYWVRGLDEIGQESTSVVYVWLNPSSLTQEDMISKPRLCAVPLEGGQSFYLDNRDDTEGILWQAIKPPDEDVPSLDVEGTPA